MLCVKFRNRPSYDKIEMSYEGFKYTNKKVNTRIYKKYIIS